MVVVYNIIYLLSHQVPITYWASYYSTINTRGGGGNDCYETIMYKKKTIPPKFVKS